jgi:peroxiredoxin
MDGRRQERTGGTASLRAGDKARDFTLTADDGQVVSLTAELRKKPVVVSFLDNRHRAGADTELATLSGCAAQIEAQGGALLAISSAVRPKTERPEALRVLHDASCLVARQYGISAPTTFVIDQAGTIVLSLIDAVPGSNLAYVNIVSALSALRLSSHTTVRTGPYTAVRLIMRSWRSRGKRGRGSCGSGRWAARRRARGCC